jgi:hypothetical protein
VGGAVSEFSDRTGPLVPTPLVTVTLTVPPPAGPPAGAVAVSWVSLKKANEAAAAPKFTAVVPVKFVPRMVTLVPPAAGPWVGEIEVTSGGPG